ncbi:diguanylate cyclase [Marinomonas ushuaiensis DSM 15871]|uniref:diguanylate cyclase n=1 Tax=Marinomonas ushuaiensis DSM 15871 TaxID=1122207 RepID=X7EB69_9GAMM|nr:diguanylate cyclase [Marinomonas ushuaiensis DSM 15871]
MENIAYIDLLTRVLNRRGIEKVFDELNIETTQTTRYAVLMIDIDHFKLINDQYGHLAGDNVLSKIAAKLNRSIHPNDLLGRWGGEEFIVVTLNRTTQQAIELAEKLKVAISELIIDDIKDITVSIGVGHSSEAESKIDVLKIADDNLYKAKKSGRNFVCYTHVTS